MAEAPPIESGQSAESPLAGPGSAALGRTEGRPAVGPARAWLRFFLSELRQVFLRRRNLLLLAVVALFPIIIGIGLRLASHPHGGGGGGGLSFVTQLTGNGIFLTFIALSTSAGTGASNNFCAAEE